MGRQAFEGKRIWITGASSGIGRALAIAFSKRGAYCILSARAEDKLEETKMLTAFPDRNLIVAMDVTNESEVAQAFHKVISSGPIDILINNAGVSQRSLTEKTQMSVYRSLMEVNFFGVIYLSKLVLDHMLLSEKGSIVTISSIAGKVGPPYRSGYAASKHALHGFFESLRSEVSHRGIHVLVVCPGYINTPLAKNSLTASGEHYGKIDKENANGLDPNDLAKRILTALAKKKNEVYFGKFEVNAIRLKRLWPALLTRLLSRKFRKEPNRF